MSRSATIVLTGGGSGGHVTPLLAVAAELKQRHPNQRIVYIGTRGDKIGATAHDHHAIDQAYSIFAGKFRRYHGEGWRQWLDLRTWFFNLRDLCYVAIGCLQSLWLIGRLRPRVIFIKGGFVGVPVGCAAWLWRRPFITHDSDAIPGLANRLIGRWARMHATGMPAELYPYPPAKTVYTGTPVQQDFQPVTVQSQQAYKAELGIPEQAPVVFMTGGGLGAQRLNQHMATIIPSLLTDFPQLFVLQTVGHANHRDLQEHYNQLATEQQKRIIIKDFVTDLHRYSGAADVVVMRASATSLAEMAVQGKACILVPNPYLTGGHQLKNAQVYAQRDAAVVVSESDLAAQGSVVLEKAIRRLLENTAERAAYGLQMSSFAKLDATQRLVDVLDQVGGLAD